MHPDYNPYTFEADLAVVELAQSVNFDQYKQPIGKSNFDFKFSSKWQSPHSMLRAF